MSLSSVQPSIKFNSDRTQRHRATRLASVAGLIAALMITGGAAPLSAKTAPAASPHADKAARTNEKHPAPIIVDAQTLIAKGGRRLTQDQVRQILEYTRITLIDSKSSSNIPVRFYNLSKREIKQNIFGGTVPDSSGPSIYIGGNRRDIDAYGQLIIWRKSPIRKLLSDTSML